MYLFLEPPLHPDTRKYVDVLYFESDHDFDSEMNRQVRYSAKSHPGKKHSRLVHFWQVLVVSPVITTQYTMHTCKTPLRKSFNAVLELSRNLSDNPRSLNIGMVGRRILLIQGRNYSNAKYSRGIVYFISFYCILNTVLWKCNTSFSLMWS